MIDAHLLEARGIDVIVNVISGSLIVALAFGAWYVKDRRVDGRQRERRSRERTSQLQLLQAELETIVSFTSQCTIAANALEQFAAYQHWLVANGLLSWKQNRLMVHTWQQTSGLAAAIRQGQVSVSKQVIEELVADMRRTEFPTPQDDHFRWSASAAAAPPERGDE